MRTRGELSLTLSILALVLMTVGSIMGVTIARNRITTDSNASSATTPITSSRWFTSNPGLACNAWFTCTQSGAKIQGVSLVQNGIKFILGDGGSNYEDQNGKSIVNKTMSSCQGGDETVSIQYNPDAISKMSATFKKSYNVDEDSIIVSMNTGGGAKTDFYVYDIPVGFDTKADARYVLDFDGTTGGSTTSHSQDTSVKGCLGGGTGGAATEKPNDEQTKITYTFDYNSNRIDNRFGDVKKIKFVSDFCEKEKEGSGVCKDALNLPTVSTSIFDPQPITTTIEASEMKNTFDRFLLKYVYVDDSDSPLADNYLVRHKPYSEITITRKEKVIKKCSTLFSDGPGLCDVSIKDGDHIFVNTIFTSSINLQFYGSLPLNTDSLLLHIETCNINGTGCYSSWKQFGSNQIPEVSSSAFPSSNETQLIRITGSYALNGVVKKFTLPIQWLKASSNFLHLECTNKPESISCIDPVPSPLIDLNPYLSHERFFNINLDEAVEIPAVSISPSVAPPGQPSPEPSPNPSPAPSDELIDVKLDLKFSMDSDKHDWHHITKVLVLIQMCDADENLKNCTSTSSYQEVFNKTYNVRDITYDEYVQEEISVKVPKGKKIFSMAMRYMSGNEVVNLDGMAPHMPFMKMFVNQRTMSDDREKECVNQGSQVFCGVEVIDDETDITARINTITRIDLNHWADVVEDPPALLNSDDKIKAYVQVFAGADVENPEDGYPVFESSPVILDSDYFESEGFSRLAHFPTVRVFDNSFVTYVLNVEYLPGQNTPVIPKPAWIDADESFFDCRSEEAKLPNGNMLYKRICTIKPNLILSDLEVKSRLVDFAFEKFTLDPLVNNEASPEVMNLYKELRSSDLNGDKVVTILDLTLYLMPTMPLATCPKI